MPNQPLVSVLLTVRDGMPFLAEAIDSVVRQSYENFRLVIVNDGSIDGTRQFLDSLNDKRINVIHQVNQGTAMASNVGLSACRGKYIARMDADDISHPQRLEEQVQYLERNKGVGLVGSYFRYIGSARESAVVPMPLTHNKIVDALTQVDHAICHGSCMYRASLARKVGGYWEHRTFDDWDLFLKIAEHSELANIPKCLYFYRLRSNSLTNTDVAGARNYHWFAVHRYTARNNDTRPLSFEQFLEKRNGSWITSVADQLDSYSIKQYRIAMSLVCDGHTMSGLFRMSFAAICNPIRAIRRGLRHFRIPKFGLPFSRDLVFPP